MRVEKIKGESKVAALYHDNVLYYLVAGKPGVRGVKLSEYYNYL